MGGGHQKGVIRSDLGLLVFTLSSLLVMTAFLVWRPRVLQDLVAYQVALAVQSSAKDPREVLDAVRQLAEECRVAHTEETLSAVRALKEIGPLLAEALALAGELVLKLNQAADAMPREFSEKTDEVLKEAV